MNNDSGDTEEEKDVDLLDAKNTPKIYRYNEPTSPMLSQNKEIYPLSFLLCTLDLNFFLLVKVHADILCTFLGGMSGAKKRQARKKQRRKWQETGPGSEIIN